MPLTSFGRVTLVDRTALLTSNAASKLEAARVVGTPAGCRRLL